MHRGSGRRVGGPEWLLECYFLGPDTEVLDKLMPRPWMSSGYGGPRVDCVSNQKNRLRQIAQLARSGRQSMLQWDDVDVERFQELWKALVDVMNEERGEDTALARVFEDMG